MAADAPGPVAPRVPQQVAGLFAGALAVALYAPIGVVVGLGLVVGVAALLVALLQGYRIYRRSMSAHTPPRTTPA